MKIFLRYCILDGWMDGFLKELEEVDYLASLK